MQTVGNDGVGARVKNTAEERPEPPQRKIFSSADEIYFLCGARGKTLRRYSGTCLGVRTPVAQGLSMGTTAHALGTATCMGVSGVHGAYVSLGLILNGIFTALATLCILAWMGV